jgi:hypothetical protein
MPSAPNADPPVENRSNDRPADAAANQPAAAAHGARRKPFSPDTHRPWYFEDLVIIVFALIGFVGGVLLPHMMKGMLPITQAILIATAVSALVYRFLGGIQNASYTFAGIKFGGSIAALVGTAMLINNAMVSELAPPPSSAPPAPLYRAYQAKGTVVDVDGNPVKDLKIPDFIVSPPGVNREPDGTFSFTFVNGLDLGGDPTFPTLTVKHDTKVSKVYQLQPGVTAQPEIDLGKVQLYSGSAPGSTPQEAATPATAPGQTASLAPASEHQP